MSALGWVARTVLISGSSTGLIPPRGAPRRASRRRTPAPPLLIPLGGAGVVGAAGDGAAAEDGVAAAGAGLAAGRARARRGAATSRVTSVSSPGTGDSSGPGTDRVTSAAAVPVVATSPATCAPVVRPGIQSIGACQSGPPVAVSGTAARSPRLLFLPRDGSPGWPDTVGGPGTLAGRHPGRSDRYEGAQRLAGELGPAAEER